MSLLPLLEGMLSIYLLRPPNPERLPPLRDEVEALPPFLAAFVRSSFDIAANPGLLEEEELPLLLPRPDELLAELRPDPVERPLPPELEYSPEDRELPDVDLEPEDLPEVEPFPEELPELERLPDPDLPPLDDEPLRPLLPEEERPRRPSLSSSSSSSSSLSSSLSSLSS